MYSKFARVFHSFFFHPATRLVLAVSSLLLFTQQRANAWNAEGHMVVAQIAYNHLDPAVKARCDSLIAVTLTNTTSINSNFVTASCWADDIRSGTSAFNNWHYIDIPFAFDGTPTNGVGADSFDVVRAISLCVSNLASSSTALTNQALFLRLLIHFVGDAEQPLHCSTYVASNHLSGDVGGNLFSLTNASWNNLHALWDAGGGYLSTSITRPFTPSSQGIISNVAYTVESHYPFVSNPGTIPNSMTWAVEGCNLAKTVSYVGITENSTPTTTYLNTAKSTTEQRLAAGGQRLADLLNTIYSTNGPGLISLTTTNNKFGFAWNSIPGRNYKVQRKGQLTDASWTDITNFVASTSSAFFSESQTSTQRLYRVIQ